MKRTLIILSVALLLSAGYFTYDTWVKDANISPWSFVPSNSILVYETNEPIKVLDDLHQTSIWKNLSFVPGFRSIDSGFDQLDSISAGTIAKIFSNTPTLVAMNAISAHMFDFLFVVEIKNLNQQTFISKVHGNFEKSGYNKKTREYEDFTITELANKEQTFTYIFYKNYFIGSFSAFLVEDAIRTVSDTENLDFLSNNSELIPLTKLERDQGNLYFNADRVSSLINIFNQDLLNLKVANSSFVDLKVNDQSINLTGFTFSEENQFLNCFKNIPSGNFDMAEIIPTNTSWVYHYSTDDPVAFGQSLNEYFIKKNPAVIAHQQKLVSQTDFDPNVTYNLLDQEIALVNIESPVAGNNYQLLMLEIANMPDAMKYYNSLAERQLIKTGDSVYLEQFGNYQIRKLPVPNYVYALLGEIAEDFKETYYLQFRNYIIMSNSLAQLKNFTISVENEDTWSKSININRFLELTNKEASFSLFVNTPRAWGQLSTQLKPEWKSFFTNQQFTFKNFEFMALQFSPVDQKFYTNITIYQPNLPDRSIPENIETLKSISLPEDISSKPWIVTNHNTKLREVLVQDTSNNIYLISNDFSVLWDLNIQEPIISDPVQIDYYKNGKLQYAFATVSAVHIIDRTGSYIPEFPKSLPKNRKISGFRVVDYDNTKNYRFVINDPEGNVFLTDKNVKPLDGWKPRYFDKPLVQSPIHKRVNGKDVFVIVEKTGKIWLMSRRGDPLPGFPIDTEADIASPLFIQNANDMDDATISVITENGEIIEVNFKGELVRREQLYKPVANTAFEIIKNVSGNTYLILRKTENNYELLDKNGLRLFSKDYISKSPNSVQYYQLGGGNEFIAFVDSGGAYLYLYDRNGLLITGRPLTASKPISVIEYENEYQIYKAVDKTLELISISY